ncbi:MAG: hypothetical protein HND39_15025 [Ignavibacteriota bacterium]|jgi:predicted DNA-binding protein|nr:hypothetical protein [Ignavibacteriales bacterium]MBL1123519.1 hypothetical protein [Ignavibacteriota bacterium]MCC7094622.1 hypothetical protein [Ignavibacteriaceae bacterium]MCE7856928.1 hypothetical protein [Ignavibacteria bacterium CHB3]MEB2296242.1 hypothetical protein [Ignavibacteria bacterium]
MEKIITSINQARLEIGKTYDLYKKGKIKSETAKTRTYILRAIIEANFKYEVEQRLDELEQKIGNFF